MINLLRKNLAFLLAVVLCLSLTACGGNAPETLENIVLDDSIDYSLEDTYDEYLGYWDFEDNSYICVSENNGIYFYELYDANNDVISSGQLQYVKKYRCMYAYSEQEGIAHKCRIDHKLFGSEEDDTLYISSFGTFYKESTYFEITGNDWRTWGIVRAYGTITRDGEDTVVLVCVHKADATFYYDEEDQVLFDGVDYPITFGDNVWDLFQDIDFADLNGDGNSDVTMKFNDGGTEYLIVWFWEPEEGYVFQEDLSVLAANSDGFSEHTEYVGFWEYPDGTILEICDDEWWNLYQADEDTPFAGGPVKYDEEAAYLMNADGSSGGGKVYFDEDGNLIDSGDVLTFLGRSIAG